MKDFGTEYYKAYGNMAGSRRKNFADWIESSKKTCTLDYYLQGKQKGRDSMIKCKVRGPRAARTAVSVMCAGEKHGNSSGNSLLSASLFLCPTE